MAFGTFLRDGGYYITSVKTGRYLTAPNTPMPEQSITVGDSVPSTEGIWSFERIDTGNPDEYRYKLLPRHAAGIFPSMRTRPMKAQASSRATTTQKSRHGRSIP